MAAKTTPRTGTAKAERLHPELWDRIKNKWHKGSKGGVAGKWNARKAQLAVADYKRQSQAKYGDSGYAAPKRRDHARRNSLARWTAEDWGYAGREGDSRYLPRAVREALPARARQRENAAKKGKKGQVVPWGPEVRRLVAKARQKP